MKMDLTKQGGEYKIRHYRHLQERHGYQNESRFGNKDR